MTKPQPLSSLEGEMSPKATEGVASEGTCLDAASKAPRAAALTPPGRFAATLPSRGRAKPA
jgi:hypothetical protein